MPNNFANIGKYAQKTMKIVHIQFQIGGLSFRKHAIFWLKYGIN
jgi:hypothetical protein